MVGGAVEAVLHCVCEGGSARPHARDKRFEWPQGGRPLGRLGLGSMLGSTVRVEL